MIPVLGSTTAFSGIGDPSGIVVGILGLDSAVVVPGSPVLGSSSAGGNGGISSSPTVGGLTTVPASGSLGNSGTVSSSLG